MVTEKCLWSEHEQVFGATRLGEELVLSLPKERVPIESKGPFKMFDRFACSKRLSQLNGGESWCRLSDLSMSTTGGQRDITETKPVERFERLERFEQFSP